MWRLAAGLPVVAGLTGGCSFRKFRLNTHNERMTGKEAPALAENLWFSGLRSVRSRLVCVDTEQKEATE
ncbi:MAG: hypothetical protein ACYTDU_05120 [Planctomycetota bacterium]|jgi:hypothetical protein